MSAIKNFVLDLLEEYPPTSVKTLVLLVLLINLLWELAYLLFATGVLLVCMAALYLFIEMRDHYGFNLYYVSYVKYSRLSGVVYSCYNSRPLPFQ